LRTFSFFFLSNPNQQMTPLPKKVALVVSVVQFAEAFQLCILFPFVPFMVADFPGTPPESVGTYSGLLAAAFATGQLISSYAWGALSDVIGEKLVILISLGLTGAAAFVFGISTSYQMAFTARILAGLFNGNVGVVKTYLGKNTDSTNQGKAMALVSAAWVISSIIAPAIGGLLADPLTNFPGLFDENGFFSKYPYSLPCFVTTFVLVVSWIISLLFVEDEKFSRIFVNPCCKYFYKTKKKDRSGQLLQDDESDELNDEDIFDIELSENESESGHESSFRNGDRNENGTENGIENGEIFDEIEFKNEKKKSKEILLENGHKRGKNQRKHLNQSEKNVTLRSLPKKTFRELLFSATMYGCICFLYIGIDEVFPLFCRAPLSRGGLGFRTKDIGIALSIMSVCDLLYILFIFPKLTNYYKQMVYFL